MESLSLVLRKEFERLSVALAVESELQVYESRGNHDTSWRQRLVDRGMGSGGRL